MIGGAFLAAISRETKIGRMILHEGKDENRRQSEQAADECNGVLTLAVLPRWSVTNIFAKTRLGLRLTRHRPYRFARYHHVGALLCAGVGMHLRFS